MGLDMNLHRKVYNLKVQPSDEKTEKANKIINEGQHDGEVRFVSDVSVCYWRKFNALHKYFFDNFGKGDEDNCVDMYLEVEDLRKLLALLQDLRKQIKQDEEGTVINKEVCEDILPTQDGFFFGDTTYDKYYVMDIDDTIKALSAVIKDHEDLVAAGVNEYDIEYYYRAWY